MEYITTLDIKNSRSLQWLKKKKKTPIGLLLAPFFCAQSVAPSQEEKRIWLEDQSLKYLIDPSF
jgi:hypothetical protein